MRIKRARRAIGIAASVVAVSLSSVHLSRLRSQTTRPVDDLPYATVTRRDVDVTILAQGEVQCAEAVSVKCELENLGAGTVAGSSSSILTLAPEGSFAKEGDILCELDSSAYRDLVQTQEIKVAQAIAEMKQAELTFQIAEIAKQEFEQGVNKQTEMGFLGQIALAKSEVQRADDRLNWTIRMLDKGYVSAAQVATEKTTVQRAKLNVELGEMTLENHRRFSLPMQLRGFDTQITGARSTLEFQKIKLQREEERLALYQRQVERCTIRAPHDGMVVYANQAGRAPIIYEEATVRQRQELFKIPNLSDMELLLYLHETVVSRVDVGMRAQIQVEALPDLQLEGSVVMVSRLPMMDKGRDSSNEIKFYRGRLKLDSIPKGLLPGMTAQVVLATDQRRNALIIPAESVSIEQGHEFCYVFRGTHVERVPVVIAAATRDQLEATKGLAEGERVLLNPLQQNLTPKMLAAK